MHNQIWRAASQILDHNAVLLGFFVTYVCSLDPFFPPCIVVGVTGDPVDTTSWLDGRRVVAYAHGVLISEAGRRNAQGFFGLVASQESSALHVRIAIDPVFVRSVCMNEVIADKKNEIKIKAYVSVATHVRVVEDEVGLLRRLPAQETSSDEVERRRAQVPLHPAVPPMS